MHAIQIQSFGDPLTSLRFVDLPEPAAPGPGEVLLGVEFSPLNMHDLHVVRGQFFHMPKLPGVVGNEGVGKVLRIGDGVDNVAVGDRVLVPLFSWSWRERLVVPAEGLFPLPVGADPVQLSMLGINPPTAALLLSEYDVPERGDWIVQNCANSGVGRSVIAIARERGVKTINIVRRPDVADELRRAGADLVFVDGPEIVAEIRRAVGDGRVSLGFDGIGGAATGVLAKIVTGKGWVAAYALISGEPAAVDPMDLIAKRIKVTGFFLGYPDFSAAIPAALEESAKLIAGGRLHVPVAATYPLSAIRDAVAHTQRGGKVILDVAGAD